MKHKLFPGTINGKEYSTPKEVIELLGFQSEGIISWSSEKFDLRNLESVYGFLKTYKEVESVLKNKFPKKYRGVFCYGWEDIYRLLGIKTKSHGVKIAREVRSLANSDSILEQIKPIELYLEESLNLGFPFEVKGKVVKNWGELYAVSGYSGLALRGIKYKYDKHYGNELWDFILNNPEVLADYPSKYNSSIHSLSYKTANQFYSKSSLRESCFWYQKRVFFHSFGEACNKLRIPQRETSHLKTIYGLEEGITTSLIRTKYDAEGLWSDDDLTYWRCSINGSTMYMNSLEIVDFYFESLSESLSLEELCAFYSLDRSVLDYLESNGFTSKEQKVEAIQRLGSIIRPINIQKKTQQQVKSNEKTYHELKDSQIVIYEPVYVDNILVKKKRRVFNSFSEVKREYNLQCFKQDLPVKHKDFIEFLNKEILNKFERANSRKINVLGKEYTSIMSFCSELGIDKHYPHLRANTKGKDFEDYLLKEFSTFKRIKCIQFPGVQKVIRNSFVDSKTGYPYFLCKIEGRVLNLSSKDLFLRLISI